MGRSFFYIFFLRPLCTIFRRHMILPLIFFYIFHSFSLHFRIMRFQYEISLYKKNKSIAKNHFHRLFHSYFPDISASMQNSTFLQKKYIIDFSAKEQNRQDSFELFPSSWSIFIYQKNQYRICCFSGIQKNLPSLHFCKRRKIILPRYHSSL